MPDYNEWYAEVGRELFRLAFASTEDLPDCDYREMYDDDLSPLDAAREALLDAGFDLDEEDE